MLDKRARNIVWILGGVILLIIISEVSRPRPLDWRPNYTQTGKMPLGCHVLYEELSTMFPEVAIETVTQDPFEFILNKTESDTSATYLFVNQSVYFDEQQVASLLEYASQGNTVFIAARNFGYILRDSLKMDAFLDYDVLEEDLYPHYFNEIEKDQDSSLVFNKGVYYTSFDRIDTLHTTGLGFLKEEDYAPENSLNYIEITHGKGRFLLHLMPEAFSNYYLLNGNQAYAEKALSYLDNRTIYWDAYMKSGKRVTTSPIRFVLNEAPLKWAYYITIFGLIIFIIFTAKREQRIIKVVTPLENTSVEFTKVIGHLYLQNKDYSNLIAKKITYFLETIRSKYYLNTQELDKRFIERLAQKSGNSLEATTTLITLIKNLRGRSIHSEADMTLLNKQIEDFKL